MDSMKLCTSIPSLRASSLGPRISLLILSCNRLLFTYGSVLRILCFYSEITGFFLKQKQPKVSYEIFLSSRSFGFHIPTSLEGGGGGGLSFLRPCYRYFYFTGKAMHRFYHILS